MTSPIHDFMPIGLNLLWRFRGGYSLYVLMCRKTHITHSLKVKKISTVFWNVVVIGKD